MSGCCGGSLLIGVICRGGRPVTVCDLGQRGDVTANAGRHGRGVFPPVSAVVSDDRRLGRAGRRTAVLRHWEGLGYYRRARGNCIARLRSWSPSTAGCFHARSTSCAVCRASDATRPGRFCRSRMTIRIRSSRRTRFACWPDCWPIAMIPVPPRAKPGCGRLPRNCFPSATSVRSIKRSWNSGRSSARRERRCVPSVPSPSCVPRGLKLAGRDSSAGAQSGV